MKILIDGRLYGLENAGLGRYVVNLVTELAELDQKNSYILLLTKKHAGRVKLPPNWKVVTTQFRHYGFFEQIFLPKIIKNEKPDVVHFPHFNVPIRYKGDFMVTIHDMLMHRQTGLESTTLSAPMYFVKRLGYKTVFNAAVKNAKSIIVPSNSVKTEVTNYYKIDANKINVIYEGFEKSIEHSVDFDLVKHGVEKPYIAYVGNAYPHKNLKRLIEAVVSFNRGSENKLMLAIASSRSVFTERLRDVIKNLGAEKFVKIVGFVPDGELSSFLRNSLALVTPSLSEGFGLPGLEAMSVGCLVAASDIPVYKEVYGKHVVYFNPFDFTSIQNTLTKIYLMTQNEKKELIEQAKIFAKSYSWTKMARETLSVYEKTRSNSLRQGQ